MKSILMILTSHGQLGDTGQKTGFWLEEFAAPYYVLKDAGVAVILASPQGGQPPLDPKSDAADAQTAATDRFKNDPAAQAALASTRRLSDLEADAFDGVIFPGGHGPLWDLAHDPSSIALIEAMAISGKPIAAVCHAPAVLLKARNSQGEPLVHGHRVTGFSNSEEAAVKLSDVVPLSVETELIHCGGIYSKTADWQSYAINDRNLITGQNPASSEAVARELLASLGSMGS